MKNLPRDLIICMIFFNEFITDCVRFNYFSRKDTNKLQFHWTSGFVSWFVFFWSMWPNWNQSSWTIFYWFMNWFHVIYSQNDQPHSMQLCWNVRKVNWSLLTQTVHLYKIILTLKFNTVDSKSTIAWTLENKNRFAIRNSDQLEL